MKIFFEALAIVLVKGIVLGVLMLLAGLLLVGFVQLVAYYPVVLLIILALVGIALSVKQEMKDLKDIKNKERK